MTQDETPQWNSRYVEYARAYGMTPEAMANLWQRVFDGEEPYPKTIDRFVLWSNERIREFVSQWAGCRSLVDVSLHFLAKSYHSKGTVPKVDVHALYDTWLKERVDTLLAETVVETVA